MFAISYIPCYNLLGQLQASYWPTAGQQMLDVSVHPPKVIGSNIQSQWLSGIADENGKFLFYTDGANFYNKDNKLIGTSGIEREYLEGDVCIIPQPDRPNGYNVFFIGHINNDITKDEYLFYTTVDLANKNNIATPRKILSRSSYSSNSVTVTRTSNCKSYWVITDHGDTLKSYYVDKNGVNPKSVNSTIGGYFVSSLKIAPNGKTAAVIESSRNSFDILDFDRSTGKFSVRIKKTFNELGLNNTFYSLEFSPNSKNIFVLRDSSWNDPNPAIGIRSNNYLWVYKSYSQTLNDLESTKSIVYQKKNQLGLYEGMQLTPTGKIYLPYLNASGWGNSYIGSISNPNAENLNGYNFEPNVTPNLYLVYTPSFPSYFFQNLNYPSATIQVNAGKDTVICRDQSIILGESPQKGYEYLWASDGTLNDYDISNPTFQPSNNPLASFDTLLNYVTAYDSVCRMDTDTVRVILKPAMDGKILGSKSVCPGVKDVSYWVEGLNNDTFNWSVEGDSISTNYQDSITVNWGGTNFSAQVSLVAVNPYDCHDLIEPFAVKVFNLLDTETPNGIDTLHCAIDTYPYNIIQTNGSVYNWEALHGQVMNGNGTNQVKVKWDLQEKYGTLWINESVNTELETCFGTSDTLKVVNPSAFGKENLIIYSISANLTNSKELELNYEIKNSIFYNKTSKVDWFSKTLPSALFSADIDSKETKALIELNNDVTDEYLFQIRSENICDKEVISPFNSNIFLKIQKDSIAESIKLLWNRPFGWDEVDAYAIYKKMEDNSFYRYESIPGSIDSMAVENNLDGFNFQYYVIGHSSKSSFASRSNPVNVILEHVPFIPNVITPNGDHLNDSFVIRKIEAYPENYLKIINRYGQVVFEKSGYDNS